MARKGKDLYQMLQLRTGGGGSGRRGSKGSFLDSLKGFLPSGGGKSARGGRRSANISKAKSLTVGGPALAAVVFGCLAIGFVLGRALAPEGEGDLSVVDPRGLSPSEQGVSVDGTWTPEKEEEELSDYALVLVAYRAAERHLAADLADQLRRSGVLSARIRRIETETQAIWLTVAYTNAEPDPVLLNKLRQMRAPTAKFEETRKTIASWPPLRTL